MPRLVPLVHEGVQDDFAAVGIARAAALSPPSVDAARRLSLSSEAGHGVLLLPACRGSTGRLSIPFDCYFSLMDLHDLDRQ